MNIALTFDDGPNPPYPDELLDVLKKHGVKATFFVVGDNAQRHPDLVRRAVAGGHLVGAHSMDHRLSDYFKPHYFGRQVLPAIDVIEKITGQKIKLVRNPWLWPILSRKKLNQAGLKLIRGKFGYWLEIFQPPASWMAKGAARRAKPDRILIFHDGYNAKGGRRNQTVAAIDLLITMLKAQNYTFVTVDQLK